MQVVTAIMFTCMWVELQLIVIIIPVLLIKLW